jgi:putative ABC transport system substrate-binding protein
MRKAGVLSILLVVVLLAVAVVAEAQQPKKIPRVGFLAQKVSPTPTNPHVFADAFRQGLRDLGYMGKNILVDYRYGEGKLDSIPSQVAELVQLKFDVLVLRSLSSIRAAKQATQTMPIVMVTSLDPVATGLKLSLPLSHFGHLRFAYCGTDIGEAKQLPS